MKLLNNIMTRWKKDTKEFSMSLSNDGSNGFMCRVPRPIVELLKNPNRIKFVIKGNRIVVLGE